MKGPNVNGRVVKLNRLASPPPPAITIPKRSTDCMGEALVLAAMLGTMLKFDGRFILQLQGSGPISMLMADYAADKPAACAVLRLTKRRLPMR